MSQKPRLPPDSNKAQHANIIEFSNSKHRTDAQIGVTRKRDLERLQDSTRNLVILHSKLSELKENLEALQKVLAGTSGGHSGLTEAVRKYLCMLENLNGLPLHEKA